MMDLNLLKKILTSTEVLGVDAQPLRDFITAFQAGKIKAGQFDHLLITLSNIIATHKFAANSQPVQVQMLLQQLKQAMDRREADAGASAPQAPSDINMHLLNALLDLKSEMKNLKEGIPQSQIITQVVHASPSEEKPSEEQITMGTVYINPLEDTKEIKGNVNIESKTGSSMGDKLSRLKGLKKGSS